MTDTAAALAAERERAMQRLRALQREFAAIVAAAGSAAGSDDEHDPEGATVAFERQHLAALLDQARAQIAQVDAALGRLADGRYGICVVCGEPIGPDRLTARPTAVSCIRCAALRR